MGVIERYRLSLEQKLVDHPRDLGIQHRISAAIDIETRLRLLSRGGIRVIEGDNNPIKKE